MGAMCAPPFFFPLKEGQGEELFVYQQPYGDMPWAFHHHLHRFCEDAACMHVYYVVSMVVGPFYQYDILALLAPVPQLCM